MSTADQALAECQTLVKANIVNLPIDDGVLATFAGKFRQDFENAFAKQPGAWARDRPKITTLARSIATFAEFAALSDPARPGRVEYPHLKAAYELLAPFCRPQGVAITREYCTTAQP
jgi:hypothetical protein